MILVIDIGNTNFTIGIMEGEKIKGTFRMTTNQDRTSDEYGFMISGMLEKRGIQVSDIDNVVISSVVPDVMHSLNSGIIKYFGMRPLIVGPGVKTGIKVLTENPKEIGSDRIVDAVAGVGIYGGPILVIDFGTATTYDLISGDGELLAGVTSPGIRISARALWEGGAKLPKIQIEKPKSILARETISSMQAGVFYGTIGQTEYIVREMIKASGLTGVKVVATGGLGKMIAEETECIQIYDPWLTLEGLQLIYEKNKNR